MNRVPLPIVPHRAALGADPAAESNGRLYIKSVYVINTETLRKSTACMSQSAHASQNQLRF